LKKELQIEPTEFEQHMKAVFEPHHFEDGQFVFSVGAMKHALDSISFSAMEVEIYLRENSQYFQGKFSILDSLRQMQAVASMMSIAIEKYDVQIH
jgi:hypothetical protein